MKKIRVIYLSFFLIISANLFGQIKSSDQNSENLEFNGIIKASDKNNFELSECISTSALIMGVKSKTRSRDNAVDSSFVRGKYTLTYYVDEYTENAGDVKYKFEYKIKNGEINYRFFEFEHEKSDSKFKSLGPLPEKWNNDVKKSFTERQFKEILIDIKLNVAHTIKMVNKYCLN